MNKVEKTFCMLKPVIPGITACHDIVFRFVQDWLVERNSWCRTRIIAGPDQRILLDSEVEKLYAEHVDKPFYSGLIEYALSGPSMLFALEGEEIVAGWRHFLGDTNPHGAPYVSLRRTYGSELPHNVAHGSDSEEAALRELNIFFPSVL